MLSSEHLKGAKALLIADGWRTHLLRDRNTLHGKRCAWGALIDSDANGIRTDHELFNGISFTYETDERWPAAKYLADAMPCQTLKERYGVAPAIAIYNNSQKDFDAIAAWFDKGIELAEAAEMHRELESYPKEEPVMTVSKEEANVTK